MKKNQKIRFGLCCLFIEEKISFKSTTFKHFASLSSSEQEKKLDLIVLHNIKSLLQAIEACAVQKIHSFRIISTLLPLYTHPEVSYDLHELPSAKEIMNLFAKCKSKAEETDIRLTFHPDQFVVLNSPKDEIVKKSIEDLNYHVLLSDLLGADVINIHAGGVYGDKTKALERLRNTISCLPSDILKRLSFENDDKSYSPVDLLPICEEFGLPLVYDVHHHRCLKDALSEQEASKLAYATWNREPLFHISSPKDGWDGPQPLRHHDYINPDDFPLFWKDMLPLTVDIEAKAKEIAVHKIMQDLY